MEKQRKNKGNAGRTTNICFNCQKACGKCSWTEVDPETNKIRFEPVPGWTAKPVALKMGFDGHSDRITETYHITACPEFVPDGARESNNFELTDEQFAFLLHSWRMRGEFK